MWLPQQVVREHKRRATAVWLILLLGWLSFALWTIVKAAKERENPPSKTTVVREAFNYPDVMFCFIDRMGCYSEATCADTANVLVYYELYDYWEQSESYPECIIVNLSRLDVNFDDAEEHSDFKTSFHADVQVEWTLGDGPYEGEDSYVNAIRIFTSDTSSQSSNEQPYQYIGSVKHWQSDEDSSTVLPLNDISLRKTQFKTLGGAISSTISANSISNYEGRVTEGIEYPSPTGILDVRFDLNDLSILSIEEVDPLDVSTIIGSIGGFWQYVIIGWGAFFVFHNPDWQKRKARHLGKAEKFMSKLDGTAVEKEMEITSSAEACAASSFRRPIETDMPVVRRQHPQLSSSQWGPVGLVIVNNTDTADDEEMGDIEEGTSRVDSHRNEESSSRESATLSLIRRIMGLVGFPSKTSASQNMQHTTTIGEVDREDHQIEEILDGQRTSPIIRSTSPSLLPRPVDVPSRTSAVQNMQHTPHIGEVDEKDEMEEISVGQRILSVRRSNPPPLPPRLMDFTYKKSAAQNMQHAPHIGEGDGED